MSSSFHIGHGNRCSCGVLADAIGCARETIRFGYCKNVLARRWRLECNHGCHETSVTPKSVRWRHFGELDAVKAILLKNE